LETFRTLTAVDSVIVVIDVAKGVEEQTEKLVAFVECEKFIIVFINKIRPRRKRRFDLMDEVEQNWVNGYSIKFPNRNGV
jgi:peptide chain release factor 3